MAANTMRPGSSAKEAIMRKQKCLMICAVGTLVLAGCATMLPAPTAADALAAMKASFKTRGQADVARLDQDELQRACSEVAEKGEDLPKAMREKLEAAELSRVVYPADGKYLGDWRNGERIAQNGRGFQWSDDPKAATGANCYACHQIDKKEVSYGNIGPTLNQYGKLRGASEPILKYTWAKIYNSHAFNACSSMPRYGTRKLITEAQMQDVMALLLDPDSPVNK
jgi:L-cysteine S-thiosulfotransferase